MARKENYFLPVKNLFTTEFLREALKEFEEGKYEPSEVITDDYRSRNTLDLYPIKGNNKFSHHANEYASLYGARLSVFMTVNKVGKHRDTIVDKYASRNRACALSMPLNDHTKFKSLKFYETMDSVDPFTVLNYAGNSLRPYLLNVDKIHEVDRSSYPSITIQFEYESFQQARDILIEKKLLDSSYHP